MEDLRAALARAVDANWEAQLAFFSRLVAFPSTRGAEGPCQDWIAGELARRGYAVDRYTLAEAMADGTMETLPGFSPVMDTDYAGAVQVVARHPSAPDGADGPGRSLILQGHVDVVPPGPDALWTSPPFEPVSKDGWLHGRGAGDMKGGVSAIVFALDALRDAGLAPDGAVTVQTVTEEECTGNGALSTTARGYRADAVLIAEPTAGTITRAHVGVMWFRVKVRGIPVHVAQAQEGTNAILSAFHLLQALAEHTKRLNARAAADPVFGGVPDPIKFNPGVIRGGDWASSTPAWCEVDCRISLLPGWSLADARRGVEECVAEAARLDRFLANNPPEVEWNGFQADGYHLEPGSEAERVLAEAHRSAFGAPMEARLSTAVNDTRFYGLYKRIPALCYGSLGENHHGFDERGHLDTLRTTTLSIALFIARWCGTRPVSGP